MLKANTVYESKYSEEDNEIVWFWQIIEKFTLSEKENYLKFVWGRNRLPSRLEDFEHKHTIKKSYNKLNSLPIAHTCFFAIDIPEYSSFEIMYKRFHYAVHSCNEIDADFEANNDYY
jgi:hypothetical protein